MSDAEKLAKQLLDEILSNDYCVFMRSWAKVTELKEELKKRELVGTNGY